MQTLGREERGSSANQSCSRTLCRGSGRETDDPGRERAACARPNSSQVRPNPATPILRTPQGRRAPDAIRTPRAFSDGTFASALCTLSVTARGINFRSPPLAVVGRVRSWAWWSDVRFRGATRRLSPPRGRSGRVRYALDTCVAKLCAECRKPWGARNEQGDCVDARIWGGRSFLRCDWCRNACQQTWLGPRVVSELSEGAQPGLRRATGLRR